MVLHCIASYCVALYCTVLCCAVWYCIVSYCFVLFCSILGLVLSPQEVAPSPTNCSDLCCPCPCRFLLPHNFIYPTMFWFYRLIGLVVRRPPRERKIPGSNPACDGIFSGWSHTSDSKIGTPVATLPGAWRYRVSAGTGRPGVSIL